MASNENPQLTSSDLGVPDPDRRSEGTDLGARLRRMRSRADTDRVPLATIVTSVALVGGTYVAAQVLLRLREVVLMLVVAGFVALILNPMVAALQRWRVRRRGAAVAIVALWAGLVFVGLVAAFGFPLSNGISHLSRELPAYVQHAESGSGTVGRVVRALHLQVWVERNAPKLNGLGDNLAEPALRVGQGAASALAGLATISALIVLLLLEGPKLRVGILDLLPPDQGARWSRVAAEMNRSVLGYAFGNLLTSVIAGVIVSITLLSLRVPFPWLWGLWVALVDFLPMIGGMLAGIPTVLFATGHSLTAGVVTAVVFVLYQQLENHVLNPVVMSRTVRVNPLLVLVSVLVGHSIGQWLGGVFGGFVAALLAIPTAGALQVLVRELWYGDPEPKGARLTPVNSPRPE